MPRNHSEKYPECPAPTLRTLKALRELVEANEAEGWPAGGISQVYDGADFPELREKFRHFNEVTYNAQGPWVIMSRGKWDRRFVAEGWPGVLKDFTEFVEATYGPQS